MAFSFLNQFGGTPGFNPQAQAPQGLGLDPRMMGNLFDYQDPAGMGLLSAGAALLQAGAPTTTKQGIAPGIGSALMNYVQGQSQARRGNVLNALQGTQLSELLRQQTQRASQEAAVKDLVGQMPEGQRKLLSTLDPSQVGSLLAGQAIKAQEPIAVPAGGSLVERGTGKPLYTNPKTDRPTDTQVLLEASGLVPGTPAYQAQAQKLIDAKTRPLVSIDMGHKADEELLKSDIKVLNDAREGMAAEVPMRQRMQLMVDQLLSGTQTGPMTEITLPLKNLIVEAGLASADQAAKWSDQELFRATAAYLTPRMRVAGSGTSSDRDMSEFKAALPTMAKSPQANLIIGASTLQLQNYNAERTKLMDNYLRENKNLKGFGDYADKQQGPVFPTVTDPAEAAKLRPGTVYKGPDGRYRVRRSVVPGTE